MQAISNTFLAPGKYFVVSRFNGPALIPIWIGTVTMGTDNWNISLLEIQQYNTSPYNTWQHGSKNYNTSICYTDNTNTSLLVGYSMVISNYPYLCYFKHFITAGQIPSYWTIVPANIIPGHTAHINLGTICDINLDSSNKAINVWWCDTNNTYFQINTWALQGNPEATTTIAGNSASFGGAATYNGLTTYNAQANFNNPVKHSFTYNNNFQVMTVTGQINTNVNHVISIGAITLTLPNATNAKIGQIIHIHLGPNTVTGQNPTIIIPANSGMKMCIGQNTGGVISYTFVSTNTEISLKLLYIGSYNASATLYWIAV